MGENPGDDQERHAAKDEADRRFNETVRNLLNTPHKPHKDKGAGKPSPKPKRDDAKASDRR